MSSSPFTITAVQQILAQLTNRTKLYVAYSGGVDSHVLLHVLASLRNDCFTDVAADNDTQFELSAIHIDHGLHPNSHKWAEHCKEICQKLQVPCIVRSVYVRDKLKKKESLEAVARRVRYEEFAQILLLSGEDGEDTVLLTAHHADDQAETVMLQLLRGAGVKGLAAIPLKSYLGQAELLRPLLSFSREQILQYALQHKLSWIEDVSNEDLSFERNYLRHKIMPLLKKEWGGALHTLGRVAQNCAEAGDLLEVLARQDYAKVQGDVANTLAISKLRAITVERQRNVLRYWLCLQGLALPSRVKLLEIQRTILNSKSDRLACVAWNGAEVRRYQDNLYAMSLVQKPDPATVLRFSSSFTLTLPCNLGILKVKVCDDDVGGVGAATASMFDNLTVRFRYAGAKCRPKGRKTHSLKNLFQEWQIPPWQRSSIPLIYQGDKLVAIAGYCVCEGWDERVVVEWQKP